MFSMHSLARSLSREFSFISALLSLSVALLGDPFSWALSVLTCIAFGDASAGIGQAQQLLQLLPSWRHRGSFGPPPPRKVQLPAPCALRV